MYRDEFIISRSIDAHPKLIFSIHTGRSSRNVLRDKRLLYVGLEHYGWLLSGHFYNRSWHVSIILKQSTNFRHTEGEKKIHSIIISFLFHKWNLVRCVTVRNHYESAIYFRISTKKVLLRLYIFVILFKMQKRQLINIIWLFPLIYYIRKI